MEQTMFGKGLTSGGQKKKDRAALRARAHEQSGQPTGELRLSHIREELESSKKGTAI